MLKTDKNPAFLKQLFNDELYLIASSQIEIEVKKEVEKEAEVKKIIEKEKYPLLVFIHEENQISGEDTGFLGKILKAVQIELDTIKLVNLYYEDKKDLDFFLGKIAVPVIISFSSGGLFSKIKAQKYQPTIYSQCQYLWADQLAEIRQDVGKKKLLWESLQKVFAIT